MIIGEYKTVSAASVKELDYAVNRHIKMGFQPFGNPYVAGSGSQQSTFQALVRAEGVGGQESTPARSEGPKVVMPPSPKPLE